MSLSRYHHTIDAGGHLVVTLYRAGCAVRSARSDAPLGELGEADLMALERAAEGIPVDNDDNADADADPTDCEGPEALDDYRGYPRSVEKHPSWGRVAARSIHRDLGWIERARGWRRGLAHELFWSWCWFRAGRVPQQMDETQRSAALDVWRRELPALSTRRAA